LANKIQRPLGSRSRDNDGKAIAAGPFGIMFTHQPRPAGFLIIRIFFVFGSLMSAYAAITLVNPARF